MKKLTVLLFVSLLLLFAFPSDWFGAGEKPADYGTLVATAKGSQTGVVETDAALQAYTFYTAPSGQRVYKPSAVIPAGSLVKLGTCAGGYAQVEYQAGDGWWHVDYLPCE
jgi:hypothetical protein